MKVVGISCSPRQAGNVETMLREALGAVQELGGETEFISVSGKAINPCDACDTCAEKGVCRINDDMQEIYQKLLTADGIILATPSYFSNVSAQAKLVMDRTELFIPQRKLRGKVAGAIVVCGSVGVGQCLGILYSFFMSHRMHIAGGAIGFSSVRTAERSIPRGLVNPMEKENARGLGKAIFRLRNQLSK